ncbi:DUF4238 domain-containing protein [Sulfitobacter geojensis]|uniref:DUF4238 domain-containing protein n=2 Tax=Sulfitobacter geojensis TaxID=1342299 RepID=A0AAE3B465_9RHOB|nr:DUF4238 domain-containing protein [Sulfitobacter geojensis]MBM1691758.1 DUF4238 domain-containing protein [Sulfitobacter geojensis]MBM1703924.1 DUF4238 domain-containing protein [Sulfitobacter geojensis]MBM1707982.1 DUF4238 domain-containing protein [Sulfitobacter geojensis]MBM1712047.1 DUF4238 domain-containing protein [Sulfitobacter geojensis]
MAKSREHHWWPVGHQKHWTNKSNAINILAPDGRHETKKVKNRKVGKKSHGHTTLRGGPWETNFEDKFEETDNRIHQIIDAINPENTVGSKWEYFKFLIKQIGKKDRKLSDICKFGRLSKEDDLFLLEYILLLLIRWPSHRAVMEKYSILKDKDSVEEIGKGNMLIKVRTAEDILSRKVISNHYYVFIHSFGREFILGDGMLDGLTSSLTGLSLQGHALLPLTPSLCLYICTPTKMRTDVNYAAFSAPPWMVDYANEITQVYSKDQLFYRKKKPRIEQAFSRAEFCSCKYNQHPLIDHLNSITGYGSRYRKLSGEVVEKRLFGGPLDDLL